MKTIFIILLLISLSLAKKSLVENKVRKLSQENE